MTCPHFFSSLLSRLVLLLFLGGMAQSLVSCGEDRTHEYEEATACGHWMQDLMQAHYLWGDSVKDLAWKQYFGDPQTIFKRFTQQAPVTDSWSWCSIDTTASDTHTRGYFNHLNSYGLDLLLMTDPTGETSRTYARIISVYPDSPAEQCGLQRGYFIGAVDGTRMSSSLASNLVSGKSRTLEVLQLGVNDSLTAYEWTSTDTITLSASTYVEDKPYPTLYSFEVGGQTAVYLQCNRLTEGPTEIDSESQTYVQELSSVMSQIRALSPQTLILDLRLCNDGTLSMSQRMASYLVSGLASDAVFAKTIYRSDLSDQNESLTYLSSITAQSLDLQQLIIITGSYTTGAAEWLIRALKASMGDDYVVTVGTTTAGQIVNTEAFSSDYYVTLHPATCYVADGTGDYDYADGISPDAEIDESSSVVLYPYGDARETILATILEALEE